jgi:hypothetical protein
LVSCCLSISYLSLFSKFPFLSFHSYFFSISTFFFSFSLSTTLSLSLASLRFFHICQSLGCSHVSTYHSVCN